MHRETFIAKLTEMRQIVEQLLGQLQSSEHDAFAAHPFAERKFTPRLSSIGARRLHPFHVRNSYTVKPSSTSRFIGAGCAFSDSVFNKDKPKITSEFLTKSPGAV